MDDKENMVLRDELTIAVYDKDGNLKTTHQDYDLITNAGLAGIASLIGGGSSTAFNYIAIGTGTTAAAATDTALGTELKRKSATVSYAQTNVANDTVVLTATFSSSDSLSGTSAVTESGVFNASSDGTMLCRQTFSALNVNWDNGDTIQITWKITVS